MLVTEQQEKSYHTHNSGDVVLKKKENKEFHFQFPIILNKRGFFYLTGRVEKVAFTCLDEKLRIKFEAANAIMEFVNAKILVAPNYLTRSAHEILDAKNKLKKVRSSCSIEQIIEGAIQQKVGNCEEMARVAMLCPLQKARIELWSLAKIDHAFNVIREKDAPYEKDWDLLCRLDPYALICDTWLMAIFFLQDAPKHLLGHDRGAPLVRAHNPHNGDRKIKLPLPAILAWNENIERPALRG